MIQNKKDYLDYLEKDACNYRVASGREGIKAWLFYKIFSTPISDQSKIWNYIKTLRKCEYYLNSKKNDGFFLWGWKSFLFIISLHRLRKLARLTGFQIPPNTIGKGITIWHWGPCVINGYAQLGENCTLRPDIVIGYKDKGGVAPKIGNNVVINSGCRIIGNDIIIGDNVIIAPGAVVTKSIPSNCIVGGIPAKVLKNIE